MAPERRKPPDGRGRFSGSIVLANGYDTSRDNRNTPGNAHEITAALGGRWCGSYGMARCPTHDDKTPSLQISDGDKKDDVVVFCHSGCDWRDVRNELRAMGLLPEFERRQQTLRQSTRRQVAVVEPDPQMLANRAHAKEIWAEAKPAVGTLAEVYLRGRGITVDIPSTLRFAPNLKHTPTGLWLPALVAAVTVWPERNISAIHRTYLKADGSAKAPSTQAKMLLGPSRGGAVRLMPAADELIVCEGIETGLSVLQITGKPIWAAISAGGLLNLQLPDISMLEKITIAADNDIAGLQAAKSAAAKWIQEGRTVDIAVPPKHGADWNDVLQGSASWAA